MKFVETPSGDEMLHFGRAAILVSPFVGYFYTLFSTNNCMRTVDFIIILATQ